VVDKCVGAHVNLVIRRHDRLRNISEFHLWFSVVCTRMLQEKIVPSQAPFANLGSFIRSFVGNEPLFLIWSPIESTRVTCRKKLDKSVMLYDYNGYPPIGPDCL
jgi:hypothetical protein